MELKGFIDAHFDALQAIQELGLNESNADVATDLPGWSVRDILAHLLHIEEALTTGVDPATHSGGAHVDSAYTQAGVDSLSGESVEAMLARLSELAEERGRQLDPPPSDPKAPAPNTPAGMNWDTGTLLRNRMLDVWVHEQDLRRALGLPLRLDAPAARLTLGGFAAALPMIFAKRAGVPAGHPVRIEVSGPFEFVTTLEVDEGGRAAESNAKPQTEIVMTSEEFLLLMAGRTKPSDLNVVVTGDTAVADAILAAMNIVP